MKRFVAIAALKEQRDALNVAIAALEALEAGGHVDGFDKVSLADVTAAPIVDRTVKMQVPAMGDAFPPAVRPATKPNPQPKAKPAGPSPEERFDMECGVALAHVGAVGPCRRADVQAVLGVAQPRASVILRELVLRGLIKNISTASNPLFAPPSYQPPAAAEKPETAAPPPPKPTGPPAEPPPVPRNKLVEGDILECLKRNLDGLSIADLCIKTSYPLNGVTMAVRALEGDGKVRCGARVRIV